MKITAIKSQIKQAGRYSIFIDEVYVFSLSDTSLLESKLVKGQELTEQQVRHFKALSDDDKLYNRVLGYIALRPRSEWEIKTYLERKKSPTPLVESILNKLRVNRLLDDAKFADAYVHDRRLLRPTSRRKMILELKKKRLSEEVIREAVGSDVEQDQSALDELVVRKRRQTRYQDDKKLMQYLAGQGFGYGDIKSALSKDNSPD